MVTVRNVSIALLLVTALSAGVINPNSNEYGAQLPQEGIYGMTWTPGFPTLVSQNPQDDVSQFWGTQAFLAAYQTDRYSGDSNHVILAPPLTSWATPDFSGMNINPWTQPTVQGGEGILILGTPGTFPLPTFPDPGCCAVIPSDPTPTDVPEPAYGLLVAIAAVIFISIHAIRQHLRLRRLSDQWNCTCESDPLGRCVIHKEAR